jgi:DNA-binding NarL/FixJ family response regulator
LNKNKTTILLADDHAIVRRGIKALLEYEPDFVVVAEAADGVQALEQVEITKPDVLVTDLCMPNMSGIELLKAIKAKNLPMRSVVLSMCGDAPYVTGALNAGAYGYVLKESGVEHLVIAIREAQEGRRYLSPPLTIGEQTNSGISDSCECRIETTAHQPAKAEIHRIPPLNNFTFETGV